MDAKFGAIDPDQASENLQNNQILLAECKQLQDKISSISDKLTSKFEKAIEMQYDLNSNKIETYDQIDKFFDEMVQKVQQRREALKGQYSSIETREKRRLKNKQMKLQKEISLVDEFKNDFTDFIQYYDLEMDYLANKASYENGFKTEFQELMTERINRRSDNDIFSRSQFKMPSFSQMGENDISMIDQIGRIVDNSDFSMPLVVFNTQQLQAFSFQEHLREFSPVDLIDEDNLAQIEIPRYFKSIYIPDDKFMLIGGLERHTSASSARCFGIDERGRINRL